MNDILATKMQMIEDGAKEQNISVIEAIIRLCAYLADVEVCLGENPEPSKEIKAFFGLED